MDTTFRKTVPLALAALSTLATLASGAGSQDPTEVAEDVEVMRRLLSRALDGALLREAPPVTVPGATNTQTGEFFLSIGSLGMDPGPAVTHSRGFHLPGVGALFTVDAVVPVVEAQAPNGTGEEVHGGGDDLWRETELEVRRHADGGDTGFVRALGGLTLNDRVQHRAWSYDPEAIEGAIDAVLETLGRHARNLEHVARDESFTVALHLTASDRFPVIRTTTTGVEASTLSSWLLQHRASNLAPHRVVIEVSQAALLDRRLGADELRTRARVHRY